MPKATLSMDVRVGESLSIDGGRVVITVEAKSGQRARLTFTHAGDATVRRIEPPKASAAHAGTLFQPKR